MQPLQAMCKETLVPTILWGGTRTADVQVNAEAESLSITWRQYCRSGAVDQTKAMWKYKENLVDLLVWRLPRFCISSNAYR
jgi:hypothetical protein